MAQLEAAFVPRPQFITDCVVLIAFALCYCLRNALWSVWNKILFIYLLKNHHPKSINPKSIKHHVPVCKCRRAMCRGLWAVLASCLWIGSVSTAGLLETAPHGLQAACRACRWPRGTVNKHVCLSSYFTNICIYMHITVFLMCIVSSN